MRNKANVPVERTIVFVREGEEQRKRYRHVKTDAQKLVLSFIRMSHDNFAIMNHTQSTKNGQNAPPNATHTSSRREQTPTVTRMVTNAIMTDITTVMHATLHPWSYSKCPIRTSPGRRNGTPSAHNTSPPLHHLPLLPTLWLTIPPTIGMLQNGHCWTRAALGRAGTEHTNLSENPFSTCRFTEGADTPDTGNSVLPTRWRIRTTGDCSVVSDAAAQQPSSRR